MPAEAKQKTFCEKEDRRENELPLEMNILIKSNFVV